MCKLFDYPEFTFCICLLFQHRILQQIRIFFGFLLFLFTDLHNGHPAIYHMPDLKFQKSDRRLDALHYLTFTIITIGIYFLVRLLTLVKTPSLVVVLLVTIPLFPISIFIVFRFGRSYLLSCFLLLYSPSLAYYSAQQWVIWNTKLLAIRLPRSKAGISKSTLGNGSI